MASDIDDVIGTGHHVHITVFINDPGVGSIVVTRESTQIGIEMALARIP